ncbi:hypothetical protein CCC_03075 [Paramagnetospirillum magnetotacticum MS-1]|uniref:Uncharacterized protein n=1 Tax=Paramagnetospirillum magnetotacticum MS-1 TaxID=272627 RepID=A0A0C2V5E0_PARME|nr:hypothetical protein [Paramagnetospirillum magnetotacticum]KIM00287.1 hypothetical protein CCC_03075 [Paramagnetospirillum magnetotacticum MS-1]
MTAKRKTSPASHAKWRQPDGSPVACVEKLKVLEENLAEFRTLALELLEDAVLMGCDPELVRDVLKAEVEAVDTPFRPKTGKG